MCGIIFLSLLCFQYSSPCDTTNLEVFLLSQVVAVVGPGPCCLGFTALLLVSEVLLLLDLLLEMLLVSGVGALLLLLLL